MTSTLKTRLLGSIGLTTILRVGAAGALLTLPARAFAAGTGMPWEQPLQQILDSVQGPVAKIITVVFIIGTGLALAFGELSGGLRRLLPFVFGL